jgi:hypothetical protein
VPIDGLPPNLSATPPGCRFEPRCPYRREICRRQAPELLPVPEAPAGHEVRCWGMQDVAEGGWLRNVDWHATPPPVRQEAVS